jgi:hypothetical protein
MPCSALSFAECAEHERRLYLAAFLVMSCIVSWRLPMDDIQGIACMQGNRDPRFYDLGLCGPDRTDLIGHADYCGPFKTPTLRNVARRGSFFHNGRFHNLRQVLEFYATRDTDPARWYPRNRDEVSGNSMICPNRFAATSIPRYRSPPSPATSRG